MIRLRRTGEPDGRKKRSGAAFRVVLDIYSSSVRERYSPPLENTSRIHIIHRH